MDFDNVGIVSDVTEIGITAKLILQMPVALYSFSEQAKLNTTAPKKILAPLAQLACFLSNLIKNKLIFSKYRCARKYFKKNKLTTKPGKGSPVNRLAFTPDKNIG